MKETKRVWSRGILLAAAALLGNYIPGMAQYQEPPPPAAYGLENVTVVHADGRREAAVNLLVRGGFIVALGPDLLLPSDASILEGDSLLVYPGLVDAHGRAPLEMPRVENIAAELPWNPSRDAQAFTPHRLAAWYLSGTGADGREARRAGVIAASIHPDGGMAPGQSVALLFRPDAETPWETVARPSLGLAFSFQGARGVFPGSLFAVMAHFRQMFENAAHEGLIRTEYARSPSGLALPKWDPDYEALRQAASGQIPVFFAANTAGDIRRVLSLADEIGFRPIILGGEEAWEVREELSSRGIPVLVSVDFPRPIEWVPSDGEAATVGQEPLEPSASREKERLENAYANASRLVEAGVTVALTSGGRGGDFREGVRKAMKYGLAEASALQAVTGVPASILGIPHVVTVELGMAANFIVTDGPIFGADTEILYTFVEGMLEKGSERRSTAGREAPSVNVTGSWDLVVSAQGMEMPFTMSLIQEGAGFSGTMSSEEVGEAEVTRGDVSGNELSFTLVFATGSEIMELEANATVEGDTMTGTGSGAMGSFTFRATRKPGARGGIR